MVWRSARPSAATTRAKAAHRSSDPCTSTTSGPGAPAPRSTTCNPTAPQSSRTERAGPFFGSLPTGAVGREPRNASGAAAEGVVLRHLDEADAQVVRVGHPGLPEAPWPVLRLLQDG